MYIICEKKNRRSQNCLIISSSANNKRSWFNLKEYLSAKEASEYTGISVPKLARLRLEGRGCTYIRIGDSKTKAIVRYKRNDLDRWLERNRIQTTGGM
jgi:hypothetical protein